MRAPTASEIGVIDLKMAHEDSKSARVIYGYATRYLKWHYGMSGGIEVFSRGC